MSPFIRFFIAVFLLLGIAAHAATHSEDDTLHIKSCRNYFNITLSLSKPIFSATLVNQDEDLSLKYRTVNPFRAGVAFDYRWFGFELSTNLPTFKGQDVRKGKTESSSIRFSINSRKFWITATLQQYQGFYLHNDDYFYNPLSTDSPLPKRPDISCVVGQINGFYIFNHRRFSNPAAVGQYERQTRSGGSPFVGIGYLANTLKGDSSFVPGPSQNRFPNLSSIRSISSSNLYFSAGYAYTFVYRESYFLAVYAAPGLGRYEVSETTDRGTQNHHPDLGLRFEARAVAGYNGRLWYLGAGYFGYWNSERLYSGNYLNQTFQTVRFFVGRRFGTRKGLGFLGL